MPRQTLGDKVRGWVHSLGVQVVENQSKRKVVTVAVVTKDEVDKLVERRRLAKEWLGQKTTVKGNRPASDECRAKAFTRLIKFSTKVWMGVPQPIQAGRGLPILPPTPRGTLGRVQCSAFRRVVELGRRRH